MHYDKHNQHIDRYITLNYMALFKAIKKHDKKLCKTSKNKFFAMIIEENFYKT